MQQSLLFYGARAETDAVGEARDLLAIADLNLGSGRADRRNLIAYKRKNSESQEKMVDVLDKPPRLRVILEEERFSALEDTPVTGKKGLQKKTNCSGRCGEDLLRNEFALRCHVEAVFA